LADLLQVHRFFTEIMPFAELRPAPDLVWDEGWEPGHRPIALASSDRSRFAVYLPTGGEVALSSPGGEASTSFAWFDPREGALIRATGAADGSLIRFAVPPGGGDRPWDWVLASPMD
jgi:hypothetical protein